MRSHRRDRPEASSSAGPGDMVRALAGLHRFIIGLRAVAVLILTGGAWAQTGDRPIALASGTVVLASLLEVLVLHLGFVARHPGLPLLVLELTILSAVLISGPIGPVFFCSSIFSAALTGAVLGRRGLPLWLAQAAVGYLLLDGVLRSEHASPTLTAYVIGLPALYVVAGVAAVAARGALIDQVRLARAAMVAIERTAVASERQRMARELHDSFAQTLKGLTFAAYALPSSLRRGPTASSELAVILADAAEAASAQAREVLETLRADDTGLPFAQVVEQTCRQWEARADVPVQTRLAAVDLGIEARHELVRILREALGNISRHAQAARVTVTLTGTDTWVRLGIQDDGIGFTLPRDLQELTTDGHFGLIGMRERATRVGGSLTVESIIGRGTHVTAHLPVAGPEPTVPPVIPGGARSGRESR